MNKLQKFTASVLLALIIFVPVVFAASSPIYMKKTGDDIIPLNAAYDFGSVSNPWDEGHFQSLNVNGVSVTGGGGSSDSHVFLNQETIENSVDGKLGFFGVGGSNNENLYFDFESQSNVVSVASTSDVNRVNFDPIWLDASIYTEMIRSEAGTMDIGSTGGSNDENLIFDFESTSNEIDISTSTGVGFLDFNNIYLRAGIETTDIATTTGSFQMHGVTGANNENLTWDFETTANTIGLSSSSGANILDFGSISLDTSEIIVGTITSDVGGYAMRSTGGSNNEALLWDFETTANEVGLASFTGVDHLGLSALRLDWTSGIAFSGSSYSVGRNTDGTNRLQYNVPTSSAHEFSINDTAIVTISGSGTSFSGTSTFLNNGTPVNILDGTDSADNAVLSIDGPDRGTPTDGDATSIIFTHETDTTLFSETSSIQSYIQDVTNATKAGGLRFYNYQAGTETKFLEMYGNQDGSDTGFVVFNEDGDDIDYRIEGSGEANAIFVEGSSGNVGIGTASPSSDFEVDGITSYEPSSTQVLTAGTALTLTKTYTRIDSGSGGAVTMTATPSIADGVDGQCVIIQGDNDTNTIAFQDESNLTDSGLQLAGGVDMTLGQGDTLSLCYDSGDDNWYEIARSNN